MQTNSIKRNTVIKEDIINRLATGENQVDIAKSHNCSQTTISELKNENKGKVELAKQRLIATVPNILETVEQDISNNQAISKLYANDRESVTATDIAYKSILQKQNNKILESIGILSSHTNINNFGSIQVNKPQSIIISRNITKLVGNAVQDQLESLSGDGDIIDIDATDGAINE